jgi:hypothetical protein
LIINEKDQKIEDDLIILKFSPYILISLILVLKFLKFIKKKEFNFLQN